MKLVFLGTTASIPTKERALSSVALFYKGEVILFDCGEGTQRQLMISELSFMKVDRIFISHFHGDHFLGIPGFIQSLSLNKRTKPLHIYGPEETVKYVQLMTRLGYFGLSFELHASELKPGDVLDFEGYSIRAVEAKHGIPALAYKFQEKERSGRFNRKRALELGVPEGRLFGMLQKGKAVELEDGRIVTPEMVMGASRKGRSLLYTGDTAPCPSIGTEAKGVDVLIHEATFAGDMEEKGNEFGHTTARQAAQLAKEAGAGKLFLTHVSPRYKNDEQILLEEAREFFPNTTLAEDFMEYEMKIKT